MSRESWLKAFLLSLHYVRKHVIYVLSVREIVIFTLAAFRFYLFASVTWPESYGNFRFQSQWIGSLRLQRHQACSLIKPWLDARILCLIWAGVDVQSVSDPPRSKCVRLLRVTQNQEVDDNPNTQLNKIHVEIMIAGKNAWRSDVDGGGGGESINRNMVQLLVSHTNPSFESNYRKYWSSEIHLCNCFQRLGSSGKVLSPTESPIETESPMEPYMKTSRCENRRVLGDDRSFQRYLLWSMLNVPLESSWNKNN